MCECVWLGPVGQHGVCIPRGWGKPSALQGLHVVVTIKETTRDVSVSTMLFIPACSITFTTSTGKGCCQTM